MSRSKPADETSARSVRYRYYAYRSLTFPGFLLPLTTLFLLDQGLSYAAITTAGGVGIVVGVAGELPTGMAADWIGRRAALVASSACFTVSQFAYLFVDSAVDAALVVAGTTIAMKLQTGTLDAWLYDALAAAGDDDRYGQVFGRGEAIRRAVGAGMMVFAGPLYLLAPAYPFLAMTGVNVCCVALAAMLPRGDGHRGDGEHGDGEHGDDQTGEEADAWSPRDATSTIRESLLAPGLRGFVLYAALSVALVRIGGTFLQPLLVEGSAGYVSGVDPVAGIGVAYAAFTLLAAAANDNAEAIEARVGTAGVLLAAPVVAALGFVALAAVPVLVLPTFLFLRPMGAVMRTVRSRYLNRRVESAGRATTMSAASLVYSLVRLPAVVLAGFVADAVGVFATMGVVGGGFVLLATGLMVLVGPNLVVVRGRDVPA